METMFEQIARDYMPMLLNWAYKKLGDREKAEDLTQEVLLQVFSAIRKSPSPITDQEHFLWKIAHYTWCSYLRGSQRRKLCVSMENLQLEDPRDFAEDYAQEELRREQTLRMRRQISLLNRLQREIMISFYIDGLSVREIAEKHQMTQSAVKWHLCQTRKKLKKEITDMENQEYVYRPRKLHMAISGTVDSMGSSDIVMLENSLTKQNLCLACYRQPKTPQELAGQLGIPMAYVEADLEWLTEREFMEMTGSGYATSFPIITSAEEQEQFAIFAKHRKVLSDVIIEGLTSAEDTIRGIGFYGCKAPMNKLLWLLIYQFCGSLHIPYPHIQTSVRMDGGNYLPLGFDRETAGDAPLAVDNRGWAYNGSMQNNGFCWMGLYNFGRSEIEEMLDNYTPHGKELHQLLVELIQTQTPVDGYDEKKRYTLAQLAQKGFVTVRDNQAFPNFCIFTAEQYAELRERVFTPIAKKLEPAIPLLTVELEKCCGNQLPRHLNHYYHSSVALALHDLSYLTSLFAFHDGLLYKPVDSHDGEFLTLTYIKNH